MTIVCQRCDRQIPACQNCLNNNHLCERVKPLTRRGRKPRRLNGTLNAIEIKGYKLIDQFYYVQV